MRTFALATAFFLLIPASAVAEAGTPPFLYVVVADAVTIESKGDDYVLKLNKDYINHILEISEKPFALKNQVSADRVVANWQKGARDFGGATMKGHILAQEGAIRDIVIKSITKTDGGNASLDLSKFGELVEVTIVNHCCHPEGGGGEWLWGGN